MNARMDQEYFDPARSTATTGNSPAPPPPDTPGTHLFERASESIRSIAGISQVLRFVGALVMIGSMSVFMLQGWSEGNDVQRYLLLLAQTALMAAGGFALSHGLKENKGARVFFGLALLSIPANFTILGALFYSAVQWDGMLTSYPTFASWQIVDPASAGVTLAGALVALVPLCLLCFAIMARKSARTLTMHFLLLNSLLLLPLRSSVAVGLLGLIGAMYAVFFVSRLARRDGALKTPEGKFAIAVLFVPTIIIVFRSMYFYHVDELLIAMLGIAAFVVLRHAAASPERTPRVAVAIDILSLPVALVAAIATGVAIEPYTYEWLVAPVFALALAMMGFDVAPRTRNGAVSRCAAIMVSTLIAASLVANLMSYDAVGNILVSAIFGITTALLGVIYRQRVALYAGLLTLLASGWFGAEELIELISRSGWVEMAIFGASTIAAASLLDRHGATLRLRMKSWVARARHNSLRHAST